MTREGCREERAAPDEETPGVRHELNFQFFSRDWDRPLPPNSTDRLIIVLV
jgi:hypothetical protein